MGSRQRRLKAIELTLTPQQVVVLWLRNALQAGTFEQGARHSPPYRGAVANAVRDTVRKSMKGQLEPLIERAVLQARREADLLYLLVVRANVEVVENRVQREREYIFLLGYLSAEMNERVTKARVETLRFAVLMFLKSVIVLDATIAQVVAERLNGQPVLFHDCAEALEEQLQLAEELAKHFNVLAGEVDVAEIDMEELRNGLRSETDRRVSVWVSHARMEMLSVFGKAEEIHAAMDQFLLLFESKSGEVPTDLVDA
jgi:hypothetical protein